MTISFVMVDWVMTKTVNLHVKNVSVVDYVIGSSDLLKIVDTFFPF